MTELEIIYAAEWYAGELARLALQGRVPLEEAEAILWDACERALGDWMVPAGSLGGVLYGRPGPLAYVIEAIYWRAADVLRLSQ